MPLPVAHADVVVDRVAGDMVPGLGLADVATGLADHDGEFAFPIQIVGHLWPDHWCVVGDLRAPDPQKDRRKLGDLALHPERHRFLMMVEIITHRADDFFGPRDHRQKLDIAQFQVGLVGGGDLVPVGEFCAADEIGQRAAEDFSKVDNGVALHGSPCLRFLTQERNELHEVRSLAVRDQISVKNTIFENYTRGFDIRAETSVRAVVRSDLPALILQLQ